MTELEPDDHPGARYALGPWGKAADPFDIVINLSDAGIANDFRTYFNLGIDDPAPINQADPLQRRIQCSDASISAPALR